MWGIAPHVITAEAAAAVSSDGNENTLTVTTVDSISANGNKNTITWSKTSDAKKNPKPAISALGNQNKISQKK